jgi:hypothetical protein
MLLSSASSLRIARFAVLLMAAAGLGGCGSRPSAPALKDGPIYRDEREGFRFFVPEGWSQRARGSVPPGPIEGERMLAEYKAVKGYPAALQVTVTDLPESEGLPEYLVKNTLTGEDWRLKGQAEPFTINNVPAARITFVKGKEESQIIREVVAFRRGVRVYFFKSFYARADERSRQALKTAVETIVW